MNEKKSSLKTLVLLCNLGTPQKPSLREVKKFLKEFLMDRRVISLPYFLRALLVYGLIIPFRSPKTTHAYQAIWTPEGSPLLVYSQSLTQKLQNYLGEKFIIKLAMRYGEPSIKTIFGTLDLNPEDLEQIIILPLYPQFSATTTASTFDAFSTTLKTKQNFPSIKFISHYYEHPLYIQALSQSIRDYQAQQGQPDLLIFSFHGLPEINIKRGDPYLKHCQITAQKLADALGLNNSQWRMTFQSRLGKQKWLEPYTNLTLQNLPQENPSIRSVQIICPGFSIDCLETLEEINIQNKTIFLNSGGEKFGYIPCLNNQDNHVKLLSDLCEIFRL